MTKRYLLDDFVVRNNRLTAKPHPTFRSTYLRDDFFVEYDEDIQLEDLDESILQIPFLLNVIPLIWISGETYRVRVLDATLCSALQDLRQAFRRLYPRYGWHGELVPDSLGVQKPPVAANEIALLFSGGVDSTYSSFMHRETPQVLISILSSLGIKDWRSRAIRDVAKTQFKEFASKQGHRSRFVTTNLCEFISAAKLVKVWPHPRRWLMEVQHGLGFVGLTAPVMQWDRLRTLLLAACEQDYYRLPGASHPSLVNAIKWSGVEVAEDGADQRRQQKLHVVHAVSSSDNSRPHPLKSCLRPSDALESCCTCSKCLQTIFGLVGERADPKTYGFPMDRRLAAHALRQRVSDGRLAFSDIAELMQWIDIQTAIRELPQDSEDAPDVDGEGDLHWFANLDLVRYFVRSQAGFRAAIRRTRRRFGLWIDKWPAFGAGVRRTFCRMRLRGAP